LVLESGMSEAARDLPNGTSRRVHADYLMTEVEQALAVTTGLMRDGKRLSKREREVLWRLLAGVIGNCESLRIWLEKGAPE
jgi:hypothetical protein